MSFFKLIILSFLLFSFCTPKSMEVPFNIIPPSAKASNVKKTFQMNGKPMSFDIPSKCGKIKLTVFYNSYSNQFLYIEIKKPDSVDSIDSLKVLNYMNGQKRVLTRANKPADINDSSYFHLKDKRSDFISLTKSDTISLSFCITNSISSCKDIKKVKLTPWKFYFFVE